MADFRVSSFIVLILFFLWAPPVESYPDGGSKVCENMTISTVCSKQQALQSESVVYVTLDFNTSRLVDGKPINITSALSLTVDSSLLGLEGKMVFVSYGGGVLSRNQVLLFLSSVISIALLALVSLHRLLLGQTFTGFRYSKY